LVCSFSLLVDFILFWIQKFDGCCLADEVR